MESLYHGCILNITGAPRLHAMRHAFRPARPETPPAGLRLLRHASSVLCVLWAISGGLWFQPAMSAPARPVFELASDDPNSADRPGVITPSRSAIAGVIAADPDLSARDRTMTILYDAVRLKAPEAGPSPQEERQRHWLKSRDRGCDGAPLRECLVTLYDARLHELASAALFRAPEASLGELARQEPEAAPVYEAIYRYASLDDEAERIDVVARLIVPLLDNIDRTEWARAGVDGPDGRSAASSDEAFSAFLAVVSGNLPSNPVPLTMPCTALIRRPALIAALRARYGGAQDGWIPRADCAATMPATPKFDRVTKAAEAQQSFCRGTIRFSTGADLEATLTAIRLHRPDLWRGTAQGSGAGATDDTAGGDWHHLDEPHFRAAHRSWIREAKSELTKYYVDRFAVAPEHAEKDAGTAIDTAISGVYSQCP
jgi:uncharacterized protein